MHTRPHHAATLRRRVNRRASFILGASILACNVILSFAAVITAQALAGDPHHYVYALSTGDYCHAMLGRACRIP